MLKQWDERVTIQESVDNNSNYFRIDLTTRTYPITIGYKASEKYMRDIFINHYGFTTEFSQYLIDRITKLKRGSDG